MVDQRTALGRHLAWVFLLCLFVLPVFGQIVPEELTHRGLGFTVGAMVLGGGVALAIVHHLARLWRAPVAEARGWHVVLLFVDGLMLGSASSAFLVQPESAGTKLTAVAVAVVALNLVALGSRETFRWRRQRAVAVDQGEPVSA